MEENKEVIENPEVLAAVNEEVDADENYDDSDEYVKAKTFPIDESWPDEIKKQVEQLNQMSAMLNAEPDPEDDADEESEESADNAEDGAEDEEEEEEVSVPDVSSQETETFNDIF